MTNKRIIETISVLDGWKPTVGDLESVTAWAMITGELFEPAPPLYLCDRNEIIRVIKKCLDNPKLKTRFVFALYSIVSQYPSAGLTESGYNFNNVMATAEELCTALLITLDKWEDDDGESSGISFIEKL